ncbi:MAG: hypothetical protein RL219_561 [Actinomycetota bacterium]
MDAVPYERDILDDFDPRRGPSYPKVVAHRGMVVEDRSSGFCGDIVRINFAAVTLRDRHGHLRHFTWKVGGFLVEGKPVTLVRESGEPSDGGAPQRHFTASGSVASDHPLPARVARASRIWVEGVHDAELVEHVWGDDLRELGIVVEPMHGIDGLVAAVDDFGPGPDRRLGILVDHLVLGSKEQRLAAQVTNPHVLVTGHPFVDVWAGIRPHVVGLEHWPEIPRGTPWKEGIARALGTESAGLWPKLRNRVRTYADLEPELVGAVERLIDFLA